MLALKIAGIMVGCFLLVGIGFIEPAKQMCDLVPIDGSTKLGCTSESHTRAVLVTLLGIAVGTFVAFMATRGVVRADKRARRCNAGRSDSPKM